MHTPPRPTGLDAVTNPEPDSLPVLRTSVTSGGVAAIVLAAGASTRLGSGRSKQLLRYQGRTLLRHSVEQALASCCRPVVVVLGAEVESCQRELAGLDIEVTLNPAWAEGMGSSIRAGMTALTAAAPDARAVVITLCDQPLVTAAFIDRLVQRYLAEAGAVAGESGNAAQAARRHHGAGAGGGVQVQGVGDRQAEPTVAAEYDGQPGVPALFPRSRFAELSRLDGAAGARRLLRVTAAQLTAPDAAVGVGAVRVGDAGAGVDSEPGTSPAPGAIPEAATSRVITLPCPEAAVDVDTITDYEALPQ